MRKKHLDLHQRVLNAAASQAVENVKAQHTYLHGRADASGEWGQIWSRDPWCSWGHIFGRMRGWTQVWKGSVTQYDTMAMQNLLNVQKIYPELGGHDPRPLMEASVHTLFTDIIEVADDGKSARGSFITPGVIFCRLNRHEYPYCNVLWERYGSDFVLEHGRWLYLHEQVCPDIGDSYDSSNWAQDRFRKYLSGELKVGNCSGAPRSGISDLRQAHNDISIIQTVQDTVPAPEAYEKLDEAHTYSPGCADFEDIYLYPENKGYGDPIY